MSRWVGGQWSVDLIKPIWNWTEKLIDHLVLQIATNLLQTAIGWLISWQSPITNCDKYITNCDKYITNCGNYYKLRRLLQIVQSSIQVDKPLQWANVKQKPFRNILSYSRIIRHIRAYSVIFRHNQAYLGILQAYSKLCVTLAYSKPWYIQKTGTFRTRGIFRILWNIYNGAFCENR